MPTLKSVVKSFIPASLRSRIRQLQTTKRTVLRPSEMPEWEWQPQWNQELSASGWNDPSVAAAQLEKWPYFVEMLSGADPFGVSHEAPVGSGNQSIWAHNLIATYGYVLGLAAHSRQQLSMLDWGGGIGHYSVINTALVPQVAIQYHCEDVPSLCAAGRTVLPDAIFHDQPGSSFANSYDFVHVGSSLWYVENWKEMSIKLAQSTRDYLYITRMMFVENAPSFVVLQRPYKYGYKTEYQCWALNKREFVEHIENQGFKQTREFLFGWGPEIHAAPEAGFFKGFLFRRTEGVKIR